MMTLSALAMTAMAAIYTWTVFGAPRLPVLSRSEGQERRELLGVAA